MKQPTIFLLENDDDTRFVFKKVLQDNGYKVITAIDEEEALLKVDDGFLKSDLLIVNLLGKSEDEMLSFGDFLRKKGKLDIPVVAIAAKYSAELEGTVTQKEENKYIIYLGEGEELLELLSQLTKVESPQK